MSGPVANYTAKRRRADGMIRKYSGGGGNAVLRRVGSPDRPCSVVIQDYSPMERIGKMINPIDRLAIVSALAPDGTELVAPNHEVDRLVTFLPGTTTEDEKLRITQPPGKLAPGNVVLYWELQVRG